MDELMDIEVVAGFAERQVLVRLRLPPGSTVADAIAAADIPQRLPGFSVEEGRVGVFSRRCAPEQLLRAGDRVELYRALKADPKAVRRQMAELEKGERKNRKA